MITLSPRIYRQNVKQTFQIDNKFDTVALHPIANIAEDVEIFHTEEISAVSLYDRMYSLPIDLSVSPTHFRHVNNSRWLSVIVGTKEVAKSRIDCVMVSGKTRCTAERVVNSTPSVNIVLNGTSSIVERGGGSYNTYPSMSTLQNRAWSLAAWIDENKTTTSSTLTLDYSGAKFSMNPWVRNFISYAAEREPVANDILTEWTSPEGFWERYYALTKDWVDYSDFDSSNFPQRSMYSANALSAEWEQKHGSMLRMRDIYLPITKKVTRVDDYNYDVEWSVPIRVAYAAASQGLGAFGGEYDVDNYAFLDRVTSISIQLSGAPYDTSVRDISYGLDSSGNLTTNVSNTNIIDIDAEEALTLGTVYRLWSADTGNTYLPWTERIAKQLLTKYKSGKFVFVCDVPAKWVIENKVKINTQMQIQLPDGALWTNKGIPRIFSVKNIVKSFKDSSFIYTLSLLEE